MQPGKRLYDGITESPSEYDKEDELMALKNLANWNLSPSAACGASCGASDKPAEEEKKPAVNFAGAVLYIYINNKVTIHIRIFII